VIQCIRGGKKASAEVWDGARPVGLEWSIPSPAPYHSFTTPPVLEPAEVRRS
jgi:cytochrome c oxidase subunit 1